MGKLGLILLILFVTTETYGLDLPPNIWVRANPAKETQARALSGMTWDDVHHQVLMFGGGDVSWWGNQVSVYDVDSNTWRDAYPPEPVSNYEIPTADPNRPDCTMARLGVAVTPAGLPWVHHTGDNLVFDSAAGVMVMYGGIEGAKCEHVTNNTWTFNPSIPYAPEATPPTNPWMWMNPTQTGNPGPNNNSSMIYDPESDLVVMFGGSTPSSSTWIYDVSSNTWTERTPDPHPPRREGHSMKYDSIHKKAILFGGAVGNQALQDTWVYDVPTDTWTEMTPAESPPPRLGHGMAFDSKQGVVILWGGKDSTHVFNDTWVYDYETNTWTQLTPASTPAPNAPRGSLVYDDEHDVFILASFGCANWTWNSTSGSCFTHTWWFRYDPNPAACIGDCDHNGQVTVGELVRGVNILLGRNDINVCPNLRKDTADPVTISNLIIAVNNSLSGCR